MFCTKCQHELFACTCPDLEDRLKAIGASGQMVLTYCSGCGTYAAKCKCPHPKPDLEQRLAGKICGTVKRRYARLENWSLCPAAPNPYQPPEIAPGVMLQGNIYEDDRFQDGFHVTTSLLQQVDGEYGVTKSGTFYKLGTVDPEWEKLFPGSRERFFAQAKKVQNG